jgi:hypothetical protein
MLIGALNDAPSAGPVIDTLGGTLFEAPLTALAARNAFKRPPEATFPVHLDDRSTLSSSSALIALTGSDGSIFARSAATPATCGVDMLVPEFI